MTHSIVEMMRRSIGILRLVSSRASSSTVMPRGAVAVESVKAGPRAATPKPTPAKATASDDSCGTAPAADDDLSDMVPMIDPMNGENTRERQACARLTITLTLTSPPLRRMGRPDKGGYSEGAYTLR